MYIYTQNNTMDLNLVFMYLNIKKQQNYDYFKYYLLQTIFTPKSNCWRSKTEAIKMN